MSVSVRLTDEQVASVREKLEQGYARKSVAKLCKVSAEQVTAVSRIYSVGRKVGENKQRAFSRHVRETYFGE